MSNSNLLNILVISLHIILKKKSLHFQTEKIEFSHKPDIRPVKKTAV